MSREKELMQKAQDESARTAEVMKRDMEKKAEQKQKDKEAAIAKIFEGAGSIKTLKFQKSQSGFFYLLKMKEIKESKAYRDLFDMSWEKFCEYVGENRRWIDEQLADLKPFKVEFLEDFLQFSGVTLNKIKYLGDLNAEVNSGINGNAITYNGETIPVDQEHAEEIQSLFETLEENHKKEKDEADTTLRTKERLLKSKEDTINKMERELKRLERTVEKSELTEEEQDGVDMLIQMQKDFLTAISDIKKKIQPHKAPEVVLRQLYYLYIFMSKVTAEERLILHEEYKEAEDVPWEISEMELPPTDVMIDNLPMTAGKGLGKKVVAKMEERNAPKSKK
ncbi:MAG: hypothetical protein ABFD76_11450 [Smithella sp.]